MEYNTKLTLHAPCVAWEHNFVKIDCGTFKQYLISGLEAVGVTGFYTQSVTGHYKGREYDEVLWTVFCKEENKDKIIGIFRQAFYAYNEFLKQESFAYECNGTMIIEEL